MDDEQLLNELNAEPTSVPEEAQNKLNTYFVCLLPEGCTVEEYKSLSRGIYYLDDNTYHNPFSNFTDAQYVAKHVSNLTGSTTIVKFISRFEIKVGDCYVKKFDLDATVVLTETYEAETFSFEQAQVAMSVLKDLNLNPRLLGFHTELFFIYPPTQD
jgi:hypothetical protein